MPEKGNQILKKDGFLNIKLNFLKIKKAVLLKQPI
jgi:hypothetical protein